MVIGIFGPTASGKTAVAEAVARLVHGEVVSCDSMQAYRGLPVLTCQPATPTRLVGIWPLDHEGSVGEYAGLAHAAIDELLADGLTPVVAGGTGLYLRAALAELGLPSAPAPGARARWEELYDRDAAEAHRRLEALDPQAAAVVHANDRRRVVRALELAESGESLVPADDRLWAAETRHPTLLVGLEVPEDVLLQRIEQRTTAMFDAGVQEEVRAALAGPVSLTAGKALGLEEVATLPRDEAHAAIVIRTRRYAAYQRKWMRRIPGLAMVNADRPADEVADEIHKWHALGNTYLLTEQAENAAPLTPEQAAAACDEGDSDGVLEVLSATDDELTVLIWNPDGSLAEMSGNGTRIAAAWLAQRSGESDVQVRVGPRTVRALIRADGLVEQELGEVEVGRPETLDVEGESLEVTPVSVGNPHAVVRLEHDRGDLLRLGPLLERHPRFPDRTNVQLVEVEDPHDLRVSVWERGAGETSASGSSAVAAAAAAVAHGWCESPVTVRLPGGELLVELHGRSGPAHGPCRRASCRSRTRVGRRSGSS